MTRVVVLGDDVIAEVAGGEGGQAARASPARREGRRVEVEGHAALLGVGVVVRVGVGERVRVRVGVGVLMPPEVGSVGRRWRSAVRKEGVVTCGRRGKDA